MSAPRRLAFRVVEGGRDLHRQRLLPPEPERDGRFACGLMVALDALVFLGLVTLAFYAAWVVLP